MGPTEPRGAPSPLCALLIWNLLLLCLCCCCCSAGELLLSLGLESLPQTGGRGAFTHGSQEKKEKGVGVGF